MQIHWDVEHRHYVLRSEAKLVANRGDLFDFFGDAYQLERITPPWLNFQILTPAPIDIQQGCLIDYRLKLRGIPIRWQTEISTWEPPFSFTDRQTTGPYRLWEHFHMFEDISGGTNVIDEVHYRVPGGFLVHFLVVKRDLKKIFAYRRQQMFEIFGRLGSEVGQASPTA